MKIVTHPANQNYLSNWENTFKEQKAVPAISEKKQYHTFEHTITEKISINKNFKVYHGNPGEPGTFMKELSSLKEAMEFANLLVREPWFIIKDTENGQLKVLLDHQGPLDKSLFNED